MTPTPLPAQPSKTSDYLQLDYAQSMASVFKALSDPKRLHLLIIVAADPDHEIAISELTGRLGISQPTVSHHMRVLTDAGIVDRTQQGRNAHYKVRRDTLERIRDFLDVDVTTRGLGALLES